MFSLALGLMFVGIGLGPSFGSIIIHITGSPLSVFLIATTQHIVLVPFVFFLLPESLSPRRMLEARRVHEEARQLARDAPKKNGLLASIGRVFSFLTPLSLFYATASHGTGDSRKRPNATMGLMFIALGYGLTLCIFVWFCLGVV